MSEVKKSRGTKVKQPSKTKLVTINEFKDFLSAVQNLKWRLAFKEKNPGVAMKATFPPYAVKTLNKLGKLVDQWENQNEG